MDSSTDGVNDAAHLRLAVDTAGLMLSEVSLAERQVRLSATFAEWLGCGRDLPLDDVFAMIHPEERARIEERFASCVAERVEFAEEFRILRPNGGSGVVAIRARPTDVTDEEPTAARWLCVTQDITSRYAEAAKQRFEATLLANISDAVIALDDAGRVTYLNHAAEHQYSITTEEALGLPLSAVHRHRWLTPEDESRAYESLRAEGRWRGKNIHITRDGRELVADSTVGRMPGGTSAALFAVSRDITDQHQLNAALRLSEARFRQLADAMPQLVWIATPAGAVTYYNERAREFAGLTQSPEGLWQWQPVVHPDDRARTEAAWRSSVETGDDYECEHRLQMRDGTYTWHLSRARRMPGVSDADEDSLWFGTATNVHAIKLAEEALREAQRAEQEVARQKDEFIAILAHELRNPLAPVRTAAALVRTRVGQDPVLTRCCDAIDRQSAHMSRLLDDLLDVSRLSRGKLSLQKGPVLLREIIGAAVDVAHPLFEAHRHSLTVQNDAEQLVIEGDAARLVQVLTNLLTNAAKYTPPGGHVAVRVQLIGQQVRLTVADDGLGIPPQMLGRIFDLFAQAHAQHDLASGLGIGLTLARQLTEMHGGTIEVQSDGEGCGSTFIVTLPIGNAARSAPADVTSTADERWWHGRRVLVADDNRDAVDMLALLFSSAGAEVQTAADGEDAIRVSDPFRPEILVLDIGMPGRDGLEVCAQVRRTEWGAAATIVALTGWGDADLKTRTEQAGFDAHLVKPIDVGVLLAGIRELRTRGADAQTLPRPAPGQHDRGTDALPDAT